MTDTQKSQAGERTHFGARYIGCVLDQSQGDADTLNKRTIAFAAEHGFNAKLDGYFDGLRGLSLSLTIEEAESVSHSGRCDEDVQALADEAHISAQLDAIGADAIRAGLKEAGAWDETELADDTANRLRAVWLAGGDVKENLSQKLSDMGDEAVSFLNEQDLLPYCSFYFDDNSLLYSPCIENAKEDVGFVSSRKVDYPPDDYEGEWLHISDHGNATLYVREKGEDKEIWGIV